MKKRVFCFLLAVLCTVCFAAPFSVCAATSLDFRSSGDASGAGYSWNAAKRTLTLNGFTLQTDAVSAIRLPKNSTVFYTGECTISSSGASAVSAEGMLSIIEKSASASIELSGAPYAAEAAETILYGNSITLRGENAAVSGSLEAEDGYSLLVLRGGAYENAPYAGETSARTGALYPVYAQAQTGGSVSFSYRTAAPGDSVRVRAYARPGYQFNSWSGNVLFADSYSSDTTFEMPAYAVRVSASFTRVYSLNIEDSEGGNVIRETAGDTFEPGATVIVYAEAYTGYYFSHWESDYGAFRDPLQAYAAYKMPNVDATIKPVFVPGESYTLTVGRVGEGTTNVTLANLPEGRRILLRATPAEGYVFSGWVSDGGYFTASEEAETTFTMPGANAYVTAVFAATDAAKTVVLVNAYTGGNVNLSGGSFVPGVTIELAATPKTGYRFISWETAEDGGSAYIDDPLSMETFLIVPPADLSVYARFALLDPSAPTFYCAVGTTEGGSVTGEETGYYIAGYELDLTAHPDEGYYFAGWTSAVGGKFDNAADEATVFHTPANDTKVLAWFKPIAEEKTDNAGVIVPPDEPLSPGTGEGTGVPLTPLLITAGLFFALVVYLFFRAGIYEDCRRAIRYLGYRRRRKRLKAKREF